MWPAPKWSSQPPKRQTRGIVELLIARSANILVKGQGHGEFWTPVKLSSYTSLPDMVDLVTPSEERLAALPADSAENWKLWKEQCDRRGVPRTMAFCNVCLAV
jgi:hypothetical protein